MRYGDNLFLKSLGVIFLLSVIGITGFALGFEAIERRSPGAFDVTAVGGNAGQSLTFLDYFYYSAQAWTLNTPGDIVPRASTARGVSAVESLLGVLALGFLVGAATRIPQSE